MPNHNRSNICSPCRKHRVSNLEESVSLLKKVKTKTWQVFKKWISIWLGNLETYDTFFYCQKFCLVDLSKSNQHFPCVFTVQGENYDRTEDGESFWQKEYAIMFPFLKWVMLLGVETEIYAFYLHNFVIYKVTEFVFLLCKNSRTISNKQYGEEKR